MADLLFGALLAISSAAAPDFCIADAKVTGYVRTEHGPVTYDGTSILTDEPIAAASWDIPLSAIVDVEDLGRYRVADRGSGLGSVGWVDIAVWTRSEAFALTSRRRVCVVAA